MVQAAAEKEELSSVSLPSAEWDLASSLLYISNIAVSKKQNMSTFSIVGLETWKICAFCNKIKGKLNYTTYKLTFV